MYGQMGHTLKAFIITIIKTPFYLLKINKRMNKKIALQWQFCKIFLLTYLHL